MDISEWYYAVCFQLQFLVGRTEAWEEFSVTQTGRLIQDYNVTGIVGPNFSCYSEAKIAGILNRAMVSYVSSKG